MYLALRRGRERGAHCAPLRKKKSSAVLFFEAVAGLWSAPDYLRKGVKIRGWKPWCLPSCAPAGQARFRSLRKRSTTVWQKLTNNTDNRNFEKAKEEGKTFLFRLLFQKFRQTAACLQTINPVALRGELLLILGHDVALCHLAVVQVTGIFCDAPARLRDSFQGIGK